MDKDLLLIQITALEENIERMLTLLSSDQLYRSQKVSGKFRGVINSVITDLDKLKTNVQKRSLTDEEFKWSWNKLQEHKGKAQRVFDQCLDYVGGIALRSWELEDGICDIAETLVQYVNQGGTWVSVAIVGEERIYDEVSRKTQLIRLRFPEWGLWSLSFTAYEFARWIAHEDYLQGLTSFFEGEKERVSQLIQVSDPQLLVNAQQIEQTDIVNGKIQKLAPDIDELRESSLAGDDVAEKLARYLAQYKSYLEEFFADAFSTYFLGPAYPYSLLCLRLDPLTALVDTPLKPSLARRMDLTWQLLRKMGEPAKQKDSFGANPYDPEIASLGKLWEQTIRNTSAGYTTNFDYGIPYNSLAESLYSTLQSTYRGDGFRLVNWEAAQTLGKSFPNGDTPTGDAFNSLPVVLNAAWFSRIRQPDAVRRIESQAYKIMKDISGKQAEVQQSTAKPGARQGR